MSWFFEMVGLVCCSVWAYLVVAVFAYFAIRPIVYPIERLQYALCWPVAPVMLLFRWRRKRKYNNLPNARIARGRSTTRSRI